MASNLPGLENILDNLDVGIIIFDNKGTYLFVNKTLLQYTGRTRQDYLNHTVYDFIASGLYKESVVDKVYHENRAVTQIHVTVSADGKQVGRLVTVSPIFNAQGEIVYAISCQIQVDAMNQKYSHAKAINAIATGIRGNWDDRREVIAKSPSMVGVLRQAARAAQSDASVLLLGESGTGKEIVAQYIHQHSPYRKKQMVAINCTSLPESLLEAELFGYEKGAFTGAASGGKIGLIEAAANNTLLLDEVNSMPLSLQAKLLRVLETKAVIPVGSVKPRAVNFRLICASNVALAQCVKEGTFRMDLYYRLNVIPITIPPLRERREDITPLADYFLDHFCQKYGLQKEFSSRVYQILNHYKWPGNIRELRNLVEHMVVMSESSVVKINQIPTGMLQLEPPSPESGPECLNEEYLRIQMALRLHGGHREKTAQYLGISRRTLQYKLKKYGRL